MHGDSDIIHYTTWSISNESPLNVKNKYHKSNDDTTSSSNLTKKRNSMTSASYSTSTYTTNTSTKNLSFTTRLKHEIKSFCCIICFLTLKSCKFHSVIVYMLLLSFLALFTQMIQGGYLSAIMTSLQTQFNMSTSKIGIILSSFDIMGVFATPILSYMGSKYNKCRILGVCAIFYVFGAVIFTIPYFLGEKYAIKGYGNMNNNNNSMNTVGSELDLTNNIQYCKISSTTIPATTKNAFYYLNFTIQTNWTDLGLNTSSNDQESLVCNRDIANTWPYYVFIIGQLFMSIGSAPLFSLGITYLCDNLDERKHASYTGIIYGAFALGPAIGYLTASFLLSKWLYLNEPAPVTETDPRWVGSWFMGFLLAAGLVFIISILLITFPDTLTVKKIKIKKDKKIKSKKKSKTSNESNNTNVTTGNPNTKESSNNQKRVLHTIDEANEIVDHNFDFLDSVSERVSKNLVINSTSNVNAANQIQLNQLDSISTISNTNSNITFQSYNFNTPSTPQTLSLPSPIPSEASISSEIVSNHKKKTCAKSLIDKIIHSKLKFKGFLSGFLKLILNLRYTLLVLIMSVECILIATFTNYMILYSQNVYQLPSSRSSILVGAIIVPAAILGAIIGGLIIRKFDLYIEGCVRLIILSSCVVVGGIFVLLFIRCEGTPSSGIDTVKQSFNKSFVDCNINCNCQSTYSPTCGIDKITYVSPCYAGCKYINTTGYYDCSCIKPNDGIKNTSGILMATAGSCSRNCDTRLVIFLIVLFVVVAFESLSITPATMLILKIIDKPLQPFALGVLRCANILLAYIPAPIVLSQVIDKTCILWNNQCIGDKGTCLEYSTFDFHFVLFGASAGIKIFSCILLIVFSLYIHKSFILRRKYRNKATLNHDLNSVHSPRQKYMIDSYVASSETSSMSSEDTSSIRTLYRKPMDKIKNQQTKSNSEPNFGVVLRKHTILEDDFTSLAGSQTSEYLSSSLDRLNRKAEYRDETSKNYNQNQKEEDQQQQQQQQQNQQQSVLTSSQDQNNLQLNMSSINNNQTSQVLSTEDKKKSTTFF